jgi:phosphate-selective porin OprO and OprP
MYRIGKLLVAAAAMAVVGFGVVIAQAAGDAALSPVPQYKSGNGFEIKLRARVYQDFAWVNDDDGSIDLNTSETRAARLGFEAKFGGGFSTKVEYDFSAGVSAFTVATVTWKGPVAVTVGHLRVANSLAESTSSRYITFMERGHMTDAFSLGRGLGVSLGKSGSNWTILAGIQKGSINDNIADGPLTIAGRTTYSPTAGNIQWHLGASLRYRETTGSASDFSYRQRPQAHVTGRLVDTGAIADSDFYAGLELAMFAGPLSLQAEYSYLSASLSDPAAVNGSAGFSGGYFMGSYFILGEGRNYDPSKGSLGRVAVSDPVTSGGFGALELAARIDRVDLTTDQIFGGEQTSYVLGLNWYLNRYFRIMLNYARSNISNASLVAANGADGKNAVDSFGIRLQANF